MTRRYLFLCPDSRKASGGIAVIYDTVETLNRAGYQAAVLHNSPNASYPGRQTPVPALYTQSYRRAVLPYIERRKQLRERLDLPLERLRGGRLAALDLRPDDVIVLPEYMMREGLDAWRENPIGIFVQNPFSFMTAYMHARAAGHDPQARVSWYIGVSEVCMDQFELLGIGGAHALPVSMNPETFPFRAEKERLITYMPRKRPEEARQIVEALGLRGRIGDYRLQALDGMKPDEISGWMQRSRFFISLQKRESIGFPAAEAMAAGCIVVGYTGLGAREYFTPETGFPVTEDDTAGLVRALEGAVAEYETDPARLDAMRRHASAEINRRYSKAAAEEALLKIWGELDAS
ncbi:glycosyltransferase family 4 protein [Paenirhodobacter populi]|nr:glycosyltransferase family 4 protein [Sinirhodobacter populi]